MTKRVAVAGVAERIGKIPGHDVFSLFSEMLVEAVAVTRAGYAQPAHTPTNYANGQMVLEQ